MKLLVFGKTGQLARSIARTHPSALCLGRDGADLSDPAACAAAIRAHRPDAVINAAAFTAVDRAETEEAMAHVVNADSPGAMARSCAGLDIPFLHVSTDYVFNGTGVRPWCPDDTPDPLNAYGRTKLAGEAAISGAGGRHLILRTSWVVSGGGANFVTTMLRLSQTRPSLNIVDDQIGGPTPASNLAEALLTIARAMTDGQAGGTHHYAGAPFTSWADFARAIFDCAGRGVDVHGIPSSEYPTPATRPLNSRLDCTALTAQFGIQPADWRNALPDMIKEALT